jgi:hypothetical protein
VGNVLLSPSFQRPSRWKSRPPKWARTGDPVHKFCSCETYSIFYFIFEKLVVSYSRRLPSHPSLVAAAIRHAPTSISPPHCWTGTPVLLHIRREAREATGAAPRHETNAARTYGEGGEATWSGGGGARTEEPPPTKTVGAGTRAEEEETKGHGGGGGTEARRGGGGAERANGRTNSPGRDGPDDRARASARRRCSTQPAVEGLKTSPARLRFVPLPLPPLLSYYASA